MNLRSMAMPTAVILAAVGMTAAAAYYEDVISRSAGLIKAADVSFGRDSEDKVISDLNSVNMRLLPIVEGDSFDISFETVYSGDVDAVSVPMLYIEAKGMAEDDEIKISDGASELNMTLNDTGKLYSEPVLLKPGEVIHKKYHITAVRHNGREPLIFSYIFSAAAVQKKDNEALLSGTAYKEEIYAAIALGSSSKVKADGFSETVYKEEKAGSDKDRECDTRYYIVKMEPETEADTDAVTGADSDAVIDADTNADTNAVKEDDAEVLKFSWYAKISNEKEKIISTNKNLDLVLNKYNISDGLDIRYEVENEAGYVSSDTFRFTLNDGELSCRKENTDAGQNGIS